MVILMGLIWKELTRAMPIVKRIGRIVHGAIMALQAVYDGHELGLWPAMFQRCSGSQRFSGISRAVLLLKRSSGA